MCVCRMGSVGSTNGNGDFRQQKLGRQNEAVLASKSGVGNRRNAGLNPILAGHTMNINIQKLINKLWILYSIKITVINY